MAKRFRYENSAVLLNGFGHSIKGEDIFNVFCKFGDIQAIKFLGRRQCVIEYDSSESCLRALELNCTRHPGLNSSSLSVTLTTMIEKPAKRSAISSGQFVMLDPPRFNNFLIPVLPSFLSN